jgi:hypothetical protein
MDPRLLRLYSDELTHLREVGAEYTHVAWGVYTHWYPGLSRHVYWNEPRGWPWGNDQDLWHLRARATLPHHLRIYGELDWWIKGSGRLTDYQWDWTPAHIDSLDLDNKGDFNDYAKDAQLLSLQLQLEYQPLAYLKLAAIYRPVFVTAPLVETGVYTVHQGSVLKHYAAAPDPAEGDRKSVV